MIVEANLSKVMETDSYSLPCEEEVMEDVGNSSEGITIELERDHKKVFEVAKHALVGKIISDKVLNKKTVGASQRGST